MAFPGQFREMALIASSRSSARSPQNIMCPEHLKIRGLVAFVTIYDF